MHKPVARDENNWRSDVFGGPKQNDVTKFKDIALQILKF